NLLRRRQTHHRRVAFYRVEPAGQRGQQVVRGVAVAPAALQLDERVRDLLRQREAFEDVVPEQLPEGILVAAHVKRSSRSGLPRGSPGAPRRPAETASGDTP